MVEWESLKDQVNQAQPNPTPENHWSKVRQLRENLKLQLGVKSQVIHCWILVNFHSVAFSEYFKLSNRYSEIAIEVSFLGFTEPFWIPVIRKIDPVIDCISPPGYVSATFGGVSPSTPGGAARTRKRWGKAQMPDNLTVSCKSVFRSFLSVL